MTSASEPAGPRVRTEVQVMFFDTDCAAVVHNIAYLRFIETARTLLAEELGLPLVEMARTQMYPVVTRTEVDYLKPGFLADRLCVEGWLECIERARFWCAFEVRRVSDGTVLATSRQQLALVQMPQGRPVRLPAQWQETYPHLCRRGVSARD